MVKGGLCSSPQEPGVQIPNANNQPDGFPAPPQGSPSPPKHARETSEPEAAEGFGVQLDLRWPGGNTNTKRPACLVWFTFKENFVQKKDRKKRKDEPRICGETLKGLFLSRPRVQLGIPCTQAVGALQREHFKRDCCPIRTPFGKPNICTLPLWKLPKGP